MGWRENKINSSLWSHKRGLLFWLLLNQRSLTKETLHDDGKIGKDWRENWIMRRPIAEHRSLDNCQQTQTQNEAECVLRPAGDNTESVIKWDSTRGGSIGNPLDHRKQHINCDFRPASIWGEKESTLVRSDVKVEGLERGKQKDREMEDKQHRLRKQQTSPSPSSSCSSSVC